MFNQKRIKKLENDVAHLMQRIAIMEYNLTDLKQTFNNANIPIVITQGTKPIKKNC